MENKMTPTPWRIRHLHKDDPESDFFIEANKTNPKAGYNIEIMGSEDGPNYEYEQRKADAKAIVTAVNSTYGQGIRPEAVPDLLVALNKIMNWELPESGTFWDNDNKEPMSYEAAFGTNGSRDYFKALAKAAIEKAKL